jgi:hypothetical protein
MGVEAVQGPHDGWLGMASTPLFKHVLRVAKVLVQRFPPPPRGLWENQSCPLGSPLSLHPARPVSERNLWSLINGDGLKGFQAPIGLKCPDLITSRHVAIAIECQIATGPLEVDGFAGAN